LLDIAEGVLHAFTTKDRNSILTDYGHRRIFPKRMGMGGMVGRMDGRKKASRLSGTLRKNEENIF
jgi:hypothetical protein